jgi:1-acyl-sn-glycerol-3-phosphate acyltransferase
MRKPEPDAWTLDGFRAEHACPSSTFSFEARANAYRYIDKLARLLRVEVLGLENLPAGRAILVANHTFGWDAVFVMSAVWHARQRTLWTLGEHAWWRFPFLRRLAATLGTVDGTPAHAQQLLEREELLLVLPGGLRESVKPRELRYRLLWGNRYGFVRAAIAHRAPIVPVACIGADDLFDFAGNAFRRGERLLRRPGIPIPLPTRILPIPHLVRLRFVIGEPIAPAHEPEQADDPAVLRRFRHEVEGALSELIEIELARRVGIELSTTPRR